MNQNLLSIEESLAVAILWKEGRISVPDVPDVSHCSSEREQSLQNVLLFLKEMGPNTVDQYIAMLKACLHANAVWAKYEQTMRFDKKRKCPF